MKQLAIAIICVSLAFGGCSSASSKAEEEEGAFVATIKYLRTHPPVKGYLPCFEERMLKRDTAPSYVIKTDDIYGLIKNEFWKIMISCSGDPNASKGNEIRHRFYQPAIIHGSATIMVDSHCGDLCGRGSTYVLEREEGWPGWHVVNIKERWIS